MILNVELTTEEIETILVALDEYVEKRKEEIAIHNMIIPAYPEFSNKVNEIELRMSEGQRLYNKIMDRITY